MKIKNKLVIQKMGSSFVIYDNQTRNLHELNEVGYTIISCLKKGWGKAEIIKSLVGQFEVDPAKAEKDYEEFLSLLKSKDLIAKK